MTVWIYALGETAGKIVKFGRNGTGDLRGRIRQINDEQHSEERFVLLAALRSEPQLETVLKRTFDPYRARRGRRTEYYDAAAPVVEYLLWLRAQHFTVTDLDDAVEDAVPVAPVSAVTPGAGRHHDIPEPEPGALLAANTQLRGPLAGTGWDYLPDPMASHQDYFTPADIVARAAVAMGGVDLDAASHKHANKLFRAAGIVFPEFFTESHSAFEHPWRARVWLNPPYGENLPWFQRFAAERAAGRVEQMCMLSPMWAFNTRQALPFVATASAMCVLSPTPKFYNPAEPGRTGTNQPHAIVYWGPRRREFREAFADVGIPCELVRDETQ